MSLSVPSTPHQRYQKPVVGLDHCGVKLKDTGEEVRRHREEFNLPLLIRASSGSPSFVRLVEPSNASLADCCAYLLVTERRLIVYHGSRAPISARSKIAQIAYEIIAGKELPTAAVRVEIANDDRKTECHFWNTLNKDQNEEEKRMKEDWKEGKENVEEQHQQQQDELEESHEEDALFEVSEDGFIGLVSRGQRPQAKVLDPSKVLIFYFVSELYIWSGRGANRALIEKAMIFARAMKETPISERARQIICRHSDHRVGCMLVRRQTEGIEDTLFKHKFEQWNNRKRATKIQRPMSMPCHPCKSTVVRNCPNEEVLVQEMALRLGAETPKDTELRLEETLLRPEDGNVFTEKLSIYRLEGEWLREADQRETAEQLEEKLTEFDMGHCYVIGWEYRVERTGVRKLDGSATQRRECGRRRKCYFYWLGQHTSVSEQCRCALALREWDTERHEHIRVEAGTEPPMLLHILGGLVSKGTGSGMFCLLGSVGRLCVAQEMRSETHFRSQTAYLRIYDGQIECLRAEHCPEPLVQCALQIGAKMARSKGLKATNEIKEMLPQAKVLRPMEWTRAPRLFRFHDNELWEMGCAHQNANFTFRQSDLRDCMFVDQGSRLWLWSSSPVIPLIALKIAFLRWYGKCFSTETQVGRGDATAQVIYAGAEPDEFKALFMEWDQQKKESLEIHGTRTLFELISEQMKPRSVDELQRRELPPGCDSKHLEDYLSEQEFQRLFQMSREQFGALPHWRQLTMKKKVHLF